MATLEQIRTLQSKGTPFEQALWYDGDVDGKRVKIIYPETEAYLADKASQGMAVYVHATHSRPHGIEELDFFLSASSIETLTAILAALTMHDKLYGLYNANTGQLQMLNRTHAWFIAPAIDDIESM